MKKHYSTLFVLIGVFTGSLSAQSTLTLGDTTTMGDSQAYYVADSFAVNLDAVTGPNVIYDYDSLYGYGTTVVDDVLDASTTPNASSYPNSDLAEDIGGDFIVYRNNNIPTSDVVSQGYVFNEPSLGQVVVQLTDDPMTIIEYPFTYGDPAVTDSLKGIAATGFGNIDYEGEVTIEIDGWGTLMLPNAATYTDVIRVKTTENSVATSFAGVNNITRIQYQYYNPSISKFPLFLHSSMDVDGTVVAQLVLSVDPLLCCVDVEEILTNSSVSLYPNPAADNARLNVELESSVNGNVSIINMLGKEVYTTSKRFNQGTNSMNLDLDELSSGIYFVKVSAEGQQVTKKLIVR